MLVGLTILIVPQQDSQAGTITGTITVSPPSARVGQQIVVQGVGFVSRAALQIVWDGRAAGMPRATATGAGRITVRFVVPTNAAPGQHTIAVSPVSSSTIVTRATLTVTPIAGVTLTPPPTPSAVPDPTTPTPSPTGVPTASPVRTATPVPTATSAPTATPVPAPPLAADATLDVPADYGSIQAAINAAQPGQTVLVAPGRYFEALHSARPGVTVLGYGAVLVGNGIVRPSSTGGTYLLIHVTHNNVTFAGFELTNAWRGARTEAASGSSFLDLYIHHVGRTGIEVSHGAVGAVVRGARIRDTGLDDVINAEAIYVGTARSADSWTGPDLTRDGVITGCTLGPNVGEGIDIKDDVSGFVVAGNVVTGAWEVGSGAINVRGHHNRLEGNSVSGNAGSGMRFGGTPDSPAVFNQLVGNNASNNGEYGFKFIDGPQMASGNSGSGNVKRLVFYGGAVFPI